MVGKIAVIVAILFSAAALYANNRYEKATFAGGCFWCMQPVFQKMGGVISVVSGYTGGEKPNPKYEEVSTGLTGHLEAVEVTYDPDKARYEDILDVFWHNIDPIDEGGQFADRGSQYKTAIFYHNATQKTAAEKSKDILGKTGKFNKPIATKILAAMPFYPAEEYHQDYSKKDPIRYGLYRTRSGREAYLKKTWGDEDAKKKLTPIQYRVTQECGTEPAFNNEYWDNKQEGIYVDRISGEPLFSSSDKFDSKTGWPSFTKPLIPGNVVEKEDKSHGMKRIEVKSKTADSHLGHLFNDGPGPAGLRYCINSASLRFISKEDLEKEGYGKFKALFEK